MKRRIDAATCERAEKLLAATKGKHAEASEHWLCCAACSAEVQLRALMRKHRDEFIASARAAIPTRKAKR